MSESSREGEYDGGNNEEEVVVETILVLYGSQRGTTEQVAHEFVAQFHERCCWLDDDDDFGEEEDEPAKSLTSSSSAAVTTLLVPRLMTLDEFLDPEQGDCQWSRQGLVIIFLSSYGVGGAPYGAKQFRKLCDAWIRQDKRRTAEQDDIVDEVEGDVLPKQQEQQQILLGIRFALCGFGDSSYTTYQMNPKRAVEALQLQGAELMGSAGVIDEQDGEEEKAAAIQSWIDTILSTIAQEARTAQRDHPIPDKKLAQMRKQTKEEYSKHCT